MRVGEELSRQELLSDRSVIMTGSFGKGKWHYTNMNSIFVERATSLVNRSKLITDVQVSFQTNSESAWKTSKIAGGFAKALGKL